MCLSRPEHQATQRTSRDYLSYSALSTYQACPLRYYFRYVARLPEPTVSASLVFGAAIHRAIEAHFRALLEGLPAPPLEELLAAYQASWDERAGQAVRFGVQEDRRTLDVVATRMLAAFRTSDCAASGGNVLGIEEELGGSLLPDVPRFVGRLDLLLDDEDAWVVRDFKTSRGRWSADQVEASAPQLLIYHELLQPLANGRPMRLEFVVLTKTKLPEVQRLEVAVDRPRIDRTKRMVDRVWRAIEARHFYPVPSASHCPACAFRVECRAWPENASIDDRSIAA